MSFSNQTSRLSLTRFEPQELLLAKQLDQRPDLLELSVPEVSIRWVFQHQLMVGKTPCRDFGTIRLVTLGYNVDAKTYTTPVV